MLHIKKKDKVIVLSGDDKGKTGEVLKVFKDSRRAVVSKINMAIKHKKPTQTDPGGRIEIERPIDISKLAVVCPKCSKPVRRAKFDRLADGKKVRVCRNCAEVIL
jgi:large subunit ribosomal protein L24